MQLAAAGRSGGLFERLVLVNCSYPHFTLVNEVLWAKRRIKGRRRLVSCFWKAARRLEKEAGEICDERMMDRHAFERARPGDFDTRGRDGAIIAAFVLRSSYADRAIVANTGF
jgi:hypothetical protein